jgi:CRP-like cAMP-binding protein
LVGDSNSTLNKQMLSLDETKLERRSLARNEHLFRQGDKVQAIYFIEDGRLRLDRRTFDGRSLVFGTSSVGEFFVEAALFADIFHCDAVATEPSRVRIYIASELGLTREAFYRTLASLEYAGAIRRSGDRIVLKGASGS